MIAITSKGDGFERLYKALNSSNSELRKRAARAINATAKKGKSSSAKAIARELATTQKVIKKQLSIGRATPAALNTTLKIAPSARIPLRDFKAKQSKRGVAYRISKTTGRKTIPGAFQGPRPGAIKASWRGHVFKRTGAARLPIVKLYGPSPWGVFVKQKLTKQEVKVMQAELTKQIDRQIREVTLRAQGIIKG